MYAPLLNSITLPTNLGGTVTYPLNKLKTCYSQSYGYWYGRMDVLTSNPYTYYVEPPPNGTYNCGPEHGVVAGNISTNRGTSPFATVIVPESEPWVFDDSFLPREYVIGELFEE